ncbi:hypothetical protein ASG01_08210 [Chryseobacterium sp. Leaf180]|uniref:hypothetical protein n=1 Tax=Chryseobacterium sp. Leaf180 TaxID=1736289 RepID=UPI0006F34C9C|nr:hypothetical protein [Chryseobacterium sp. Leaf180]KQR93835.1 hypothetical protein ASG01_08210 [Chryseobacterium sp. Leaf180]
MRSRLFLLIFISIISIYFSQDKKVVKKFVESFVEYRTSNFKTHDKKEDILFFGVTKGDSVYGTNILNIFFTASYLLDSKDLCDVNYDVKGFRMVVYNNESCEIVKNIFIEMPSKKFETPKLFFNYNPYTWAFSYNNRGEIEEVFNFQGDLEFLKYLKSKKFKFSKDFKSNMNLKELDLF